ncbi:MAG TPA: TolC family protein [Steroidobacteraceae bacterium]|nr:TolC family protein [Steroidobacteraceae bacterium]
MNRWTQSISSLLALFGSVLVAGAFAAEVPPAFAYVPPIEQPPESTDSQLTLAEASRLALVDQPVLLGREAMIEAEQHQAIAAAQLPDPKLSGGLKDLPIDTGEALSVRRDNFTEFAVGLSQEFPRAEKRRLKGERLGQGADVDRAALDNDRRAIGRDTSLAWLDVYEAEQALKLTKALQGEAELQVQALLKEYSAGKASQADWFAAKIDSELVGDKAHDWLHHALRSRDMLARWIGEDAKRPIADSPDLPVLPSALPPLIERADHHPVINGLDRRIDVSATDIALAHQAYKPDFSVELYTAYRPNYADFVGLQFTVGLPYFTKNRQDRDLSAALEQARAAKERKRDVLRELHAQVNENYVDWQHYAQRVADFDSVILPDAEHRLAAARSTYGAGSGSLEAVLLARRSLLDVKLQRLALSMEAARAQVRLDYLTASNPSSGDAP